MFALHETTRKWICRGAFFALCVAPSLATAGWIVSRNWPGYAQQCAAQLGDLLQVQVEADDWCEPRLGVTQTGQLTLTERVSGRSLFAASDAQWRWAGSQQVLSAAELTFNAGDVQAIAATVDRWLALLPDGNCELRCDSLTVQPPEPSTRSGEKQTAPWVLADVQGRLERNGAGALQARLTGRLSGDSEGRSVRMVIERPVSGGESPGVRVTIEAQQAAIPAWVLVAAAPGFDGFNAAAMFQGTVRLEGRGNAAEGSLVGRLTGVDIAAMLPPESPHRALGSTRIELTEMKWRGSRLETLAGMIDLTDGQVSRSVIAAAAKHLLCVPISDGTVATTDLPVVELSGAADPMAEMLLIDRLACQFLVNARGITLTGGFPAEAGLSEGCMAVSGVAPLLKHPARIELPAGTWVQFVIGPSVSWLPATRGALDLAERLPMPGLDRR